MQKYLVSIQPFPPTSHNYTCIAVSLVARYVEITFKTGNSMWFADGDNPGVILKGSVADSREFEIEA